MGEALSPRRREAIIRFDPSATGETVTGFCHRVEISRASFYRIRARAAQRGMAAGLEPDSRAPRHPVTRYDEFTDAAITTIRADLIEEGREAGPWSIWWRLVSQEVEPCPSRATIARRLRRLGLVDPAPRKRPRSSWHRFTRQQPNELWQLDGIEWHLPDGTLVTIFHIQDDCTRLLPVVIAAAGGETGQGARAALAAGIAARGAPSSVLTDNGRAFNQHRYGQISATERWLAGQGIRPISGHVLHPQTQGKVERAHQPVENWLAHHPCTDLEGLNATLARFTLYYNTERQHQGLGLGITPLMVWDRLADHKAHPLDHPIDPADLYGNQPLSLPPEPPEAHVGTRKVYAQGTAHWGGRRIYLGTRHGGQRIGLVLAEDMLHVYDPDGVAIARIPWPQPGGPHDLIHASKPPYGIPPDPSPKS